MSEPDPRTQSVIDRLGMTAVTSPHIPDGTFYLAPQGWLDMFMGRALDLSDVYVDLWGPAPASWEYTETGDYAARARDEVMDYVGRQMDDLCESFGLDPKKTWRAPRAGEIEARRWSQANLQWRMDERVSLGVITEAEARSIVKITVTD